MTRAHARSASRRPAVIAPESRYFQAVCPFDMDSGAVNYVNQAFSLFRAAEERRPPVLVTPRKPG
ncbi:hypothetical protein GE300_16585 [Rhodobacteraceae bacterium 2CG4]|uniref:Uncharacterized protein n=1 Tax=Halovulum marinum TaxID=2662447 RepID=A0A6L5Z5B8_9RHOB|nr:hypothetical protein [Halovulum marinum]MSU91202.1 hypothetical protein [Halovulum marinum]